MSEEKFPLSREYVHGMLTETKFKKELRQLLNCHEAIVKFIRTDGFDTDEWHPDAYRAFRELCVLTGVKGNYTGEGGHGGYPDDDRDDVKV